MEEQPSPPAATVHIPLNPTRKKEYCGLHKDVIVRRAKLRSQSIYTPCWKCLMEARDASEKRASALQVGLAAQTERASYLEIRLHNSEAEGAVLQSQIARLVEQCASLSSELSTTITRNKQLELEIERSAWAAREATQATHSTPLNRYGEGLPRQNGTTSVAAASMSHAGAVPGAATMPPAAGSSQPATVGGTVYQPVFYGGDQVPASALSAAVAPPPKPPRAGSTDTQEGAAAPAAPAAPADRPAASQAPPVVLATSVKAKTPLMSSLGMRRKADASEGTKGGANKAKKTIKASMWSFPLKRKSKKVAAVDEEVKEEPHAAPKVDDLSQPLPVDELVKKLMALLESRSQKPLLPIYEKVQELEEWRIELLTDLAISKPALRPTDSCRSLSVADSVEGVTPLISLLKKKVLLNIDSAFSLVKENVNVLRETLEVVRRHEDFQRRKLEMAKQKVKEDAANLDLVLQLCAVDKWDPDVAATFGKAADARALDIQAAAHQELADHINSETHSPVHIMAQVLARLLEDLDWGVSAVVPLFPPEHKAKEGLLRAYDDHVMRWLNIMMEEQRPGTSDLDFSDLLELKMFITSYKSQVFKLNPSSPRRDLNQLEAKCLQSCLIKTREQMSEWFDRIRQRKPEVLPSPDDSSRPCTSAPEDIFQIVNSTFFVAIKGGFEGADLCAFVVVILNACDAFMTEQLEDVRGAKEDNGRGVDPVNYAAMVNDYERLQDKLTGFRGVLASSGKLAEDALQLGTIDTLIDQMRDKEVEVAHEAAQAMCVSILTVSCTNLLERPPFATVGGGKRNATGGPDSMEEALITLEDYLGDVKLWLPEYLWARTVRTCFECVVTLMAVSLVSCKAPFPDVDVVVQLLRRYRQMIMDRFGAYSGDMEQAGLRDMGQPLRVVDLLIDVLLKGGQAGTAWTGELLQLLPPSWSLDAIVRLMRLRGDKLEPKAEQEARSQLRSWYYNELRLNTSHPGQESFWRLRSSPLASTHAAASCILECVINGE